jgi:hypothetical protein
VRIFHTPFLLHKYDTWRISPGEVALRKWRRYCLERKEYLHRNWSNKIWVTEFPGRDILTRFVGKHVQGIESQRFIQLLATEIGRSVPPEENELRNVLQPLLD